MRRKLLPLALACLPAAGLAQTNLDSLIAVWQDARQPDSSRAQAYNDYIWNGFLFSDPDSAFVLADALLAFAEQKHFPKAKAKAFNLKGISHAYRGNYPEALDQFQKCLSIYEETGNKQGTAAMLGNIGNIYDNLGNYPMAIESFQRGLAIEEAIGNMTGVGAALLNIGNIYTEQKNIPKALDHYQRALAIFQEVGNKRYAASALGNLGSIYHDQRDFARALDHARRGLAINEELGFKPGMADQLGIIGNIHQEQGETALAIEHYQKAMVLMEEIGNKKGIAGLLNSLGETHRAQGNTAKALEYCTQGAQVATSIDALEQQQNAFRCLYETYKAMGAKEKALDYHERYISARDSLFNQENTEKITRLEMQYQFDKKEAATQAEQDKKDAVEQAEQEKKDQRQRLVRNGIAGGLVFALLFLAVVWRQRNKINVARKRSDELLLNILPEEVAEELKDTGAAQARHFDTATILFTDFKGFTQLSEKVTPAELVAELNTCFKAFDGLMEKYHIEKIKTIGDAYMAAGGLPDPKHGSPADVVRAALEMQEFMKRHKAEREAQGKPAFEMRLGIHTGPVVAGIVGVKKFQYDIWGDTVNTASRMESSGEVGQVNISEATHALVREQAGSLFHFTPRGKVQAKGKGEMEMYFVERM